MLQCTLLKLSQTATRHFQNIILPKYTQPQNAYLAHQLSCVFVSESEGCTLTDYIPPPGHYTAWPLTPKLSPHSIIVYQNDMFQQVKRTQINCHRSFKAEGIAQRATVN